MPYIGSSPNFGAVESQTITTANGSTASFTLNQFVPDSDSIIVTVGNVVQEPTTAYSAVGTTITFTENVPNGDTIVIRYLGRSVDVPTTYTNINRFKFVATSGQDTFQNNDANGLTLSYTAGNIDVFMNGVRLDEADFTASNGTSVVLGTNASASDEIVIIAYKSVLVSNGLDKSSGGTVSGTTVFSGQTTFSGQAYFSGGIFGDVSFDSGTLKIDAGNNRVGVNTNSPTHPLHVVGDLKATGSGVFGSINATSVANISINSQASYLGNYRAIGWGGTANGTTHIYSQVNTVDDLVLHAGTAKGIVFETGGSSADRMTLDTNGSLNIGGLSTATAHHANMSNFRVGKRGFLQQWNGNDVGALYINNGIYYDTSGYWKYSHSAGGNVLGLNNGDLYYYRVQDGTAGNTATLEQTIFIDQATGYLEYTANRNSVGQYLGNAHATSPYGVYFQFTNASPDNNDNYFLTCHDTTTARLRIYSDGDVLTSDAGTLTSDEKLKDKITDASDKWEDLKKLKVRNFYWKKDYHPNKADKKMIGFIAQEFETVFPGLVTEIKDKEPVTLTDENGKETFDEKDLGTTTKVIKEGKLIPILTKALQEAITRIETLEAKVKALEEA